METLCNHPPVSKQSTVLSTIWTFFFIFKPALSNINDRLIPPINILILQSPPAGARAWMQKIKAHNPHHNMAFSGQGMIGICF